MACLKSPVLSYTASIWLGFPFMNRFPSPCLTLEMFLKSIHLYLGCLYLQRSSPGQRTAPERDLMLIRNRLGLFIKNPLFIFFIFFVSAPWQIWTFNRFEEDSFFFFQICR